MAFFVQYSDAFFNHFIKSRVSQSWLLKHQGVCKKLPLLLTTYLNNDAASQGSMGVDVADLGLAVTKVQLHDTLVDLLLSMDLKVNKKKG